MILGPATPGGDQPDPDLQPRESLELSFTIPSLPPPPGSFFGWPHKLGMDFLLFPDHLTILYLEFLLFYLIAGIF